MIGLDVMRMMMKFHSLDIDSTWRRDAACTEEMGKFLFFIMSARLGFTELFV